MRLMQKLLAGITVLGVTVMAMAVAAPGANAARLETGVGLGSSLDLSTLVVLDALSGDDANGNLNLRDLILLEAASNGSVFGGTTGVLGTNLGELVLLDELFSDNGGGVFGDGLGGGGIDLRDLFLIDAVGGGGLGVGSRIVVVESGDTLRSIALQYLGDASRAGEIAALNGVQNADLIFPGQRLALPADGIGLGLGSGSSLSNLILLDVLFGDDDNNTNSGF